eukprot:scaffold381656_cov63-Attheya_sp.AAC.1
MDESNNQAENKQAPTTATSTNNHSQALNNSFDQKMAELEARLQAQINNIQTTQEAQQSKILDQQFETHVKKSN